MMRGIVVTVHWLVFIVNLTHFRDEPQGMPVENYLIILIDERRLILIVEGDCALSK